MRAFRRRDFLLFWIGAFLSFVGSWIQITAQGQHVYELTHDESRLGWVSFCGSAPVALIGLFAGTVADMFDKRVVLCIAQVLFGLGALMLGVSTQYHVIAYWQIIGVALMFGIVGSFEGPTRQSVVSRVVPPEDLAAAIPINALTFNFARVVGPSIAGFMLVKSGPAGCYYANAFSYLALIAATLAIRSDLSPTAREPQPIKELLFEGMRYAWREPRLRALFLLESVTSSCGLAYSALMPAIVGDVLKLGKQDLGFAYGCVGLGAVAGLVLVSASANYPIKTRIAKSCITVIGLATLVLATATTRWVAYPALTVIGAAAIGQFNITNTLFQLLSPDRLRGRVIAMHFWALSGVGPFGILASGYLARTFGIPVALRIGGTCVLVGAAWGWSKFSRLDHGI